MDIVERLRDLAKNHDDYGPYDHAADPYLLQEAAAEIERLRAELLEQARIIGMSGERELALRAEIERLREALALYAVDQDCDLCERTVSYGDAAQTALTETQP